MSRLVFLICLLLSISSTLGATQGKCRGLALEGGGDKGSYQAGGVKGLIYNLPAEEVAYDVVSGISVGSLNTLAFAMYPKGEEKNASEYMSSLWDTVNKGDVYKAWFPGGSLQGFFFEKGLYNTEPLRDLLDAKLGPNHQARSAYMGTTDQDTGKLTVYHNLELNREDFINSVMSSSAFPFEFPFQNWNKQSYTDGGCKINLNVYSIIEECRQKGFADQDIIIDAVMCSSDFLEPFPSTGENTINVLTRLRNIMSYDKLMYYISEAKESWPEVDFRYFVFPSKALPDAYPPLHFNEKDMQEMYAQGVTDAINTIKKGDGQTLGDEIKDYIKRLDEEANGF